MLEASFSLTLLFTPESDGGFTVTCDELPEFLTDGKTLDDAMNKVEDAFLGVLDIYIETKRQLPESILDYAAVVEKPTFSTKTPSAEHQSAYCFQATMPPSTVHSEVSFV